MGQLGAGVGAAIFIALAGRTNLPLWAALATVVANVAGFFGWTALSRVWRGGTRYILLEHAFVAAGTTTMVAFVARVALVKLLDPWVVALALALGFGRVGCLLSGCCHGKPAARGVRYRWRLPWLLGPRWYGIRLYPLQAIEAAGLVALFAVGVALLAYAGKVAAMVAAGYAVLRFELELWRGDERRYIGPLSHNQWSCIALTLLVALLDVGIAAVAAAAIAALALIQRRRFVPPAIVVTSEAQMAALRAAIAAAHAGQRGQAAGLVVIADGEGGITARGAWGPIRPSESRVFAIAVEAARSFSAS